MLREYRIGFGIGERANGTLIDENDREQLLDAIKLEAARQFGGFDLKRGEGGWIDTTGRLVLERSATLSIITDDPHQMMEDLAYRVRNIAGQHSVILFYPGGEIRFIGE